MILACILSLLVLIIASELRQRRDVRLYREFVLALLREKRALSCAEIAEMLDIPTLSVRSVLRQLEFEKVVTDVNGLWSLL